MKKIKIISLFLVGLMGLTALAACKNNSGEGKNKSNPLEYTIEDSYSGTHIFNVSQTSDKIVTNGQTDYKVVIPNIPEPYELTAIKELCYFFEIATNIDLELVSDADAVYSPEAKYISVGGTNYAKSAGVEADYLLLKTSGLRIVTKGKSVILKGAKARGTLYAVYEFLTQCFNYEYFADTAIRINTGVKELPLMNFDITDVPDYEYNVATYGYIRHNTKIANRFRMVTDKSLMIPVGANMYHNSFDWFPKEKYEEEHPGWYSPDGYQLCYTARGDAAEYDIMLATATETAKAVLSDPQYADYNILTLTHQDTQSWCTCDTCQNVARQYNNSNAAVVIHFLNKLKANIDAWFEGEGAEYSRDLKLLFFGYHMTNKPPTIEDANTGEHEIVDQTVKCAPGVAVYFAETNGDYTQSFYDEINSEIATNMKGYGRVTDDIFFWSYQVNFAQYLTPFNSFDGMQEIYQYAKKCNAFLLFDQGAYNENGKASSWSALKVYLSYKLSWNVNADMEKLINDWFENYFGPAACYMKKMFDSFRVRSLYNQNNNGYTGIRSIMLDALQAKFWPKSMLNDWLSYTEEAMESIEYLEKTNSDLYEAYSQNIRRERLSPLYLLVELYNSRISKETIQEYKLMFYKDAQELGLTQVGEKAFLQTVYSNWGI